MIKGFPTRKDNIVLAAVDIISENGIQGLSTKGIAAKQEISESLLYKHFKGLDEVLIAVIEYFAQFDTMIFNTVLKRDISCKEKILTYINSFVELYESYPALTAILLNYETLFHYDHTGQLVNDVVNKRLDFLAKVIETGQNTGEISKYYTSRELTDIINGIFMTMIQRWKVSGYNYQLKNNMLTTMGKVLDRS